MAILEFKNWSVSIAHKTLVEPISWSLAEGETIAIIGESGSGKTLMTQAVLGKFPTQATMQGSILWHKEDISTFNDEKWQKLRGQEIAYMAQNPMSVFNEWQTIGSHAVEFMGSHTNMTTAQIYNKMLKTFKFCNLSNPQDIWRRYPFELSGGMLQRCMLGILMGLKSKLLIVDEPTSALDEVNAQIITNCLVDIKKQGLSMLVVTHDYNLMKKLADKIIILKKGKLIAFGDAKIIMQNTQNEYVQKLLSPPSYINYKQAGEKR